MRDRIRLSAKDDLKNVESVETPLPAQIQDNGKRVLVTPPENMCAIRSGQNWSFCDADEKAYYLKNMHPVLQEGMSYLRDNPRETRCYSLRFVDNKDSSWETLEQSFGLGYSTDVYAFEDWAKSHPTHLAIFGGFMEMVETFGEELKLRLWHEVTLLPRDDCEFEYIACHPKTGLLSYAENKSKLA
jgi:aldoxime dehydratase